MESRIESIVNGANEVVNQIYEKIGQIDSCKAVIKNLETAEISLLLPSGELASLAPALKTEQRAELMYSIRRMAMDNIDDTAKFLERLSGAPSTPVAAEPTPTPAPVTVDDKKIKASKMNVPEVEQMFKDGYSVEDIAKHYGYRSTQTVQNFITKNRIKVKVLTQGNDAARDLTETAADLKTTKKKLREFCEKNRLLKITQVR